MDGTSGGTMSVAEKSTVNRKICVNVDESRTKYVRCDALV